MWCVIPAAGRGTRLEPLTRDRPKPLLEIGGRPILAWLLERLTPAVSRACLVVSEAEGAIREAMGGSHAGIRLSYAVQERRLGVGDAILRAESVISGGSDRRGDAFAVVMGDAWYDRSLSPCLEAWADSGADGAVIVEPVVEPPGDPIGLVRAVDGRVAEIRKAVHRGREDLRVAGAAVLPHSAFRVLASAREAVLADGGGEVELEAAVTRLLAEGAAFAAVPFAGWRRNINTRADLRAVEERIRGGGAQRTT